jgi:Holliday junction resolvase-like predicted endonuclease
VILCMGGRLSPVAGWIWCLYHATDDGRLFNYPVHLSRSLILVFVEVKLRRGTGFGDPLEAVTPRKQARIRQIAELYLAEKEGDYVAGFEEVRFDVVGILLSGAGKPRIWHIEDAF